MLVEKLFCSFSTHLFHCTLNYDQYEKNMEKKNVFQRFVSMEMAAIFDFRALMKVHKTAASTAVKSRTHIEGILMKKRTRVFLYSVSILDF